MAKLVILTIVAGNSQEGFPMTLEIGNEGERCTAKEMGYLPYTELIEHYDHWYDCYQRLMCGLISPYRMEGTSGTRPPVDLKDIKNASKNIESGLNKCVKSPQMRSISDTLLCELTDKNEEIRFIIDTSEPKLQRLPWHLWENIFKRYQYAEVSLSLKVTQKRDFNLREKPIILVVFGTRQTLGMQTQLKLDKDLDILRQHLSNDAELIPLIEPELETLCYELENHRPNLLYFAGHSSSDDNKKNGFIKLNDNEDITIDDLKPALIEASEHGLQVAIFNSCDGLGIAFALRDANIPHIIVMREPVPDEVAQKFLDKFLRAFISEGKSLCLSVRIARQKIYYFEAKFPGSTWLPICLQNPNEPPLTWRNLSQKTTNNKNFNKTLWLAPFLNSARTSQPTQNQSQTVINLQQTELQRQTEIINQKNIQSSNDINKPSSPESSIICSKGHPNLSRHNFCTHCGERLKEILFTGGGEVNSSSPETFNNSIPQSSIQGTQNISPTVPVLPQSSIQGTQNISPKLLSHSLNISSTLTPGKILRGRYRVIKILGRGGFSTTYLAEDKDYPTNHLCVVKKLSIHSSNPDILDKIIELFEREATVMAQLLHPQIPKLLAYFQENQEFYLVQEFIDGPELTKEILPGKQMNESEVIQLLREVLEILVFIHAHGIIHRDIKPSNLMRRNKDGKIVLIDFGAIKENLLGQNQQATAIGTPGYAPSEQMCGRANPSSDIYALGMTAIQALTGLYHHDLFDIQAGEIVWQDRVQVSPKLTKILNKMVKENYYDRYQSATEVLQDLNTSSPVTNTIKSNNKLSKIMIIFMVIIMVLLGTFVVIKVFNLREKNLPKQEKVIIY